MARFVFGMSQSLDGFVGTVDGAPMPRPGPALFRHFTDHVRTLAGSLYGRRLYEMMRYWDEDQSPWDADPEWNALMKEYAMAWRAQPKWVVSRTLKSVGPNATLVKGDVAAFARKLKADIDGEIDVAGPELAAYLTGHGLLDEYQLLYRPIVLGAGKPYFAGTRPSLRLVSTDRVGEDAVRLTCVPV